MLPLIGSQWLAAVTTPMAAVSAVSASSTGMPAATSAPNTTSSRISVIGIEVASALLKFSEPLIACGDAGVTGLGDAQARVPGLHRRDRVLQGGHRLVDVRDVAGDVERDQGAVPVRRHCAGG